MRRGSLLLALAVALIPGAAGAQYVSSGPDVIALSFFPGEGFACAMPYPGSLLPVYVLALNVSEPSGIAYYEAKVVWNCQHLVYLSTSFPGGCIPEIPPAPGEIVPPCGAVTLPGAPVILLGTISFFVLQHEACRFDIVPVANPRLPEQPAAYAPIDDPERLVPFNPPFGDWAGMEAWFPPDECVPLPVESRSWGEIKGLYQ